MIGQFIDTTNIGNHL